MIPHTTHYERSLGVATTSHDEYITTAYACTTCTTWAPLARETKAEA